MKYWNSRFGVDVGGGSDEILRFEREFDKVSMLFLGGVKNLTTG